MSRTYTVLNVDDNEHGRYIVTRQLRQAGFAVIEAANGQQALDAMHHQPDLVLLDVHLPDIHGFEVCRTIKSNPATSSTIVVHLSAKVVQTEAKTRALQGGADAYLTEPIEAEELVATIQAMLRVRAAEEKARALATELAQKIKELEQERDTREWFVATLTHDLRNPLAAARISMDLIRREPDKAEKWADRAVRNLTRLDHMVEDLLDVSRIRAGEPLPLKMNHHDISRLAAEAVDQLTSLFGARFRLVACNNIDGQCDGEAIKRAIHNLGDNAVKYGTPNALITIQVARVDDLVKITVHNEGPVISSKEQNEIFEPFRRAPAAVMGRKPGWGIGLMLVRTIAQAHGGYVAVRSTEEEGTLFTMYFPFNTGAVTY